MRLTLILLLLSANLTLYAQDSSKNYYNWPPIWDNAILRLQEVGTVKGTPDSLTKQNSDCAKELKAATDVISAQAAEIKIKDELITAYGKISADWEARYNVLQQKSSAEIDAWQKRYQIVFDENERNKKARDRNHKFLAPSAGTALVAGVVIGILIK